jgi:hypothetical protein
VTAKNCFVLFYFIEIIEFIALFKSHAYVSEPPQKVNRGIGHKIGRKFSLGSER